MKKKFIKTLVSVITAVTMLMGSSLTAFADWDDADSATTPKVIQAADENVIAMSDASQLYLTGSLMTVHDAAGSPDPQLISNGDGTWVLIMYEDQLVSLGVNNPYTSYTEYVPDIESVTNPFGMVWNEEEGYYTSTHDNSNDFVYGFGRGYFDDNDTGMLYGQTDRYNSLMLSAISTGSDVFNVKLAYRGSLDLALGWIYYEGYNVQQSVGNSVTLAIYVLPKQKGAQTPIYTVQEIEWNATH